jgi:tetratricopeptide (TPR) repeat protein
MAELYAEQEHYYNGRWRDTEARRAAAEQAGRHAEAAQLAAEVAELERRDKEWLLGAMKQYLLVTENPHYSTYKRMDQVLFYLAFLLTEAKREDLARPMFKRLIKDHPESQFIPDGYLAFGEYYFDQGDMENALKFYDKVRQFPSSRVYGYAGYKTAWVYYNLKDYKRAMEGFVALIVEPGSHDSSHAILVREARKDMVLSYAEIGGPERAWEFFKRVGGDEARTMMALLAKRYEETGRYIEAANVRSELARLGATPQ